MMGKGADNALMFDHANRMEGILGLARLNFKHSLFLIVVLLSYSFRCI